MLLKLSGKRKNKFGFVKILAMLFFAVFLLCFILSAFGTLGNLKSGLGNYVDKIFRPNIYNQEAIITKMKEKSILVTFEVNLDENIIIDDSWGSFEIFKKKQTLTYHGKGQYGLSLDSLNSDSTLYDEDSNVFTIKVDKPQIISLDIIDDKTEISTPDQGLLRLGSVKMDATTLNNVNTQIKNSMTSKMNDNDLMNKAKLASEKTLNNFIKQLDILDDKTTIKVIFQN